MTLNQSQEAEAGGSLEFQDNQGYKMRSYLKKTKTSTHNNQPPSIIIIIKQKQKTDSP